LIAEDKGRVENRVEEKKKEKLVSVGIIFL
jgi:hypothetical protein